MNKYQERNAKKVFFQYDKLMKKKENEIIKSYQRNTNILKNNKYVLDNDRKYKLALLEIDEKIERHQVLNSIQFAKLEQKEYEKLRDKVISKYKILYKDTLAMDACEVPKETRIRLFEDEVYLAKTKAIKATLFEGQLNILNGILAGVYAEEGKDNSATLLKALEMKQKLLLEDLNVVKDDSNAVNVTFMSMSKEDFESLDVVEINEGSNNSTELGADFSVADDDNNSFEARMKAEVQKKMENLEKK